VDKIKSELSGLEGDEMTHIAGLFNRFIAKIYTGIHREYVLWMHRILFLPDIQPAGYPANPKAGYRTWLDNHIFCEISNKFFKIALTIIDFFKL
jgi:hypothetical protein